MLQDDDFEWLDEGDGPRHPSEHWAADGFVFHVEEAQREFSEAAEGGVASHASFGLSALQSAVDSPDGELTVVSRDAFLKALATAHAHVRVELVSLDAEVVRRGFDAASEQVVYLARDAESRGSWPGDELWRMNAATRILRESLYNRCLEVEIRDAERSFAIGLLAFEKFERRVRSAHLKIARNRVIVARLERELVEKPPQTRPGLRLVG